MYSSVDGEIGVAVIHFDIKIASWHPCQWERCHTLVTSRVAGEWIHDLAALWWIGADNGVTHIHIVTWQQRRPTLVVDRVSESGGQAMWNYPSLDYLVSASAGLSAVPHGWHNSVTGRCCPTRRIILDAASSCSDFYSHPAKPGDTHADWKWEISAWVKRYYNWHLTLSRSNAHREILNHGFYLVSLRMIVIFAEQ